MKHIIEVHYNEKSQTFKIDIRLDYEELLLIADWYVVRHGSSVNNEDIIKSELFHFHSRSELEIETQKYLDKIESEHVVISKSTHDIKDLILEQGPSLK